MKITWLDINASYSHSSLALPMLHAQVDGTPIGSTIEWSVVRGSIKSDQADLLSQVLDADPDIVLSSMWLFNHEYLVKLVSKIKALSPSVVIILGGPEFLGDNREFLLENRSIDGVFRGEGDLFLEGWLLSYQDRESWSSVKGLCFLLGGEYVDGGRAVVLNFSELKYPEKSKFFVLDRNFIQLETTRGCFNNCSFCVSGNDKPVRALSLEQVKERLDYYAQQGVGSIRMLDRTFNSSSSRCMGLLDLMRSYHGRLTFHLEVHPALLTERIKEALDHMPANLLHIEAGIQSLRQDVLDSCGRAGKLENALSGLDYLFSLRDRMETHADLIAGLPLYRYDALLEDSVRLLDMRAGEIQLELLKLLPGTRMRDRAGELGITYSPKPPYEVLMTEEISFDELRKSMVLSRLLDTYYNHSTWSELFREIVISSKEAITILIDHFAPSVDRLFSMSGDSRAKLLGDFVVQKMPDLASKMCEIWILNGLNVRKMPLFSSIEPMQSYLDSHYDSIDAKHMRCYKVSTSTNSWIVVYDRQKEHSRPVEVLGCNDI